MGRQKRMTLDASAGALAGCVARFVVGPLDVIKIRFQVQLEPIMSSGAHAQRSKYTGFMQAFATIMREEGVQVGHWRGRSVGTAWEEWVGVQEAGWAAWRPRGVGTAALWVAPRATHRPPSPPTVGRDAHTVKVGLCDMEALL